MKTEKQHYKYESNKGAPINVDIDEKNYENDTRERHRFQTK